LNALSQHETPQTRVLSLQIPLPKETPPNANPKPMPCCIPYVMMPPNSI
jgi:hypothetical protein